MKLKLKRVTISGYRSIKDEVILLVNDRVTILIGANDHGKSNVLDAVRCLNDETPIEPYDKNWDLKADEESKIVWTFGFSSKADLGEFTEKYKYDDSKVVEENPKEETAEAVPFVEGVPETPAVEVVPPTLFQDNNSEEISFVRTNGDKPVHVMSTPCPVATTFETDLLTLRPKIELFGPPSQNIDDKITIAELDELQHEVMKGLFIEAEIWERRKELFGPSTPQSSRALTDASELLTEKLKTDWSQGSRLRWKIQRVDDNNIEIMIQDPAVTTADVQLSKRSSGFKSYFYLHMSIKARMYGSENGTGFIFLFDEPGTYLHPRAQIDLQRAFERHADKGQIVYTTHSLFLVSKNYPERNRVVSKEGNGTLIDAKPFTKNWKALRESLGILMVNNFLIADKTLLVEGPSDRLYVGTALQILKRSGAFDIDLNDFSDVDAGQSDNYTAMAKLMKSEGRSIVCMVDGDSGGKVIQERTEKACAEEKMGSLEFVKLGEGMSSEDVFADFNILKTAIRDAALGVVNSSERVFVKDFNINKAMEEIKKEKGKTLGRTIEETTCKWFEDGKKLSKLSIAARYAEMVRPMACEDMSEESATVIVKLPDTAKTYAKQIISRIGLKEESSAEAGVLL